MRAYSYGDSDRFSLSSLLTPIIHQRPNTVQMWGNRNNCPSEIIYNILLYIIKYIYIIKIVVREIGTKAAVFSIKRT